MFFALIKCFFSFCLLIESKAQTLLHRYDFNNGTPTDSVGGSTYTATLEAGATISNGQAVFAYSGPYLNIPNTVFGSYTAISIEVWVTTGINIEYGSNGNPNYARIYQFGEVYSSSQTNSMAICRDGGDGLILYQYTPASGPSVYADTSMVFNSQTDLYVAMTMGAGGSIILYLNGTLATESSDGSVVSVPPATYFYVGKSLKPGDAGFIGLVNEFRIWGGILSQSQIATNYQQGPNPNWLEPTSSPPPATTQLTSPSFDPFAILAIVLACVVVIILGVLFIYCKITHKNRTNDSANLTRPLQAPKTSADTAVRLRRVDQLEAQLEVYSHIAFKDGTVKAVWQCRADAGWVDYNSIINDLLEKAFSKSTTGSIRFQRDSIEYVVYFSTMKQVRKDGISRMQRDVQRIVLNDGEMRWTVTPTSPGHGVYLYSIPAHTVRNAFDSKELREFNQAFGHFVRLLPERSRHVSAVDVIQYDAMSDVLRRFQDKKRDFITCNISVKEQWVFHGSSPEGIHGIVKGGFLIGGRDVKLASGASYGTGVYTAIGPKTPICYSTNSKTVILARALGGVQKRLQRPDGSCNSWLPTQDYVVFEDGAQLLPVYLVHF